MSCLGIHVLIKCHVLKLVPLLSLIPDRMKFDVCTHGQ
jgi:hypothetical protein